MAPLGQEPCPPLDFGAMSPTLSPPGAKGIVSGSRRAHRCDSRVVAVDDLLGT